MSDTSTEANTETASTRRKSAPVSKISLDELTDSLTGYDELAVEQAFGADIYDLGSIRQIRAGIFCHRRRQGDKHDEAKKFAMGLTVRAVLDYFPDPEAEPVMPGVGPETEEGKGAEQPVSEPQSSQPSAS